MVEEQMGLPANAAGTLGARAASWLTAVVRRRAMSQDLAPAVEAAFVEEEALIEAVEALEQLTASSRAMLSAVEGSALPALDQAIAAASVMANDKRVAVATRRRLLELKATVEAARTELAVMAGVSAPETTPAIAPPAPRKAKRAKAAAFAPVTQPEPAVTADRVEPPMKSVGPLRVLVGEANGVHQLQLRTLLAQIGIRPEIVASATELTEAWRREAWNLILIDVEAPEFGLETARAIRAAELKSGWACTPIVALGERPSGARGVIDSHVTKPLAGPGLVVAIEAALEAESPTCVAEITPVGAASADLAPAHISMVKVA